MKVLWFTNTASKYDLGKHSYNGGGWIESLEELLNQEESVELAISFFHNEGKEKMKRDKRLSERTRPSIAEVKRVRNTKNLPCFSS